MQSAINITFSRHKLGASRYTQFTALPLFPYFTVKLESSPLPCIFSIGWNMQPKKLRIPVLEFIRIIRKVIQ